MTISSPLSPQQAAQELLRRRSIRRSLGEWSLACGFTPARHHRLLIHELEAIVRGENDRLMVFMPPGAAKSTYTSRLFPPWYLAQDARKSIITASRTAELAERWGRSVRNLVHEFGPTLGYGIAKDNQAAGRWATSQGGEYLAAGVGGAIAGFRADLGLIDDPVRSAEDAESQRIRDRTWDWYRTDFVTRLKPGASVVLVQTRWHEDDLAGRLLAAEGDQADGGQWRVIRLPAIAELLDPLGRNPGEALWPEWEPIEQLERKRATVGPRIWSALYQQRPTAEDGTYFKKEWFRRYTKAPPRDELQVYMSGDFAVTEGGGDFTELAVWGVDSQHNVYVLDWWSGQASSDRWLGEFMRLIRLWRPIAFAGEGGPIRRAMEPQINLAMREAGTYTVLDWAGSGGDKAANARSFQAQQANGRIYWPATDWAERVIDQCLRFPSAKHDDAVDTCGLFGRYIDKTWAAIPKAPPKPDLAAAMAAQPRIADFLPPTSSPSW